MTIVYNDKIITQHCWDCDRPKPECRCEHIAEDREVALERAQKIAREFGALAYAADRTALTAGCWIDRIEMLPMAAEQGDEVLIAAIEDANRYSGRMFTSR